MYNDWNENDTYHVASISTWGGVPVKCGKCTRDNPPDSKFCMGCGSPIESVSPKACPSCGAENPSESASCASCGASQLPASKDDPGMAINTPAPAGDAGSGRLRLPEGATWPEITDQVRARGSLGLHNHLGRIAGWFVLVNAAVIASLGVISGGRLLTAFPLFLVLGCVMPLIMLMLSKWLIQRAHKMKQIHAGRFQSEGEEHLYCLVESLAARAGLPKCPQVWVYESSDMNAFATGPSRGNAMVAFSTGLLKHMDAKGIAAVAAHEISHIANGDMLTLSLVQSVVNAISMLIMVPAWFAKAAAFWSDEVSAVTYWIVSAITWILNVIVLFLGNLVVMAFSRKREYEADALAARLINPDSMIHALSVLGTEAPSFPQEQKAYAAFKINNRTSWASIFSTHPSIQARIKRLEAMES